ncbi:hypothetical protein ONS95_004370 [Cadophora gregata]|uniref:uncharacterized protein n=1 Tax=Cadophora gregata TaxID=51156 RepID=UPI0026DAC3BC|nr:uncharacterized protein ONS95_004370 [Cadophora gregata]KAK0105856.1 hypothetical protein ONS95_004370 [Cadophora gregata]
MDSNRDRSSRRPNQTARSKHRQSLSLSIRTANHVTPPAIQQATPPSQPYPHYPLPIPKDKEARALELYTQYCDAQLKEKVETSHIEPQSTASHRGGYHLTVPGPPTAHSVVSFTSSKYSLATSAYDGITDLSSVVSFDDEDEPTSAAVKAEGELMSFDGKRIKQRTRKKLSPVARAKAALVRHLGSCWVCRSRRVKCPLEHHDIDVLERLRQKRFETQRPKVENNSGSSISTSSQQTATSVNAWPVTESSFSQTDDLMGIGGGIGGDIKATLGNLDTSQLDIQSPGGAAYADISLDIPDAVSNSLSVAPNLPDFGPSPYTTYQDGQMFGIGVQRNGYFCCQHLDGICLEYFPTDEELLVHFELAHFSFTRISPAHRYVCLTCTYLNNDLIGPCSNCQSVGTIELWIYGNYIRNPSFQRHAPDGQNLDLDITNWTPTTLFSETYTTSNFEPWDRDLNGGGGFGGGYTDTNGAGDYGFDSQGGGGNGNFGGSQYDYQPSNHSSYSTNRYQGNGFGNARQLAGCTPYEQSEVRIVFGKLEQHQHHARTRQHKALIALLATFVLAVFALSLLYTWPLLITKAQQTLPYFVNTLQSHIQLLGFLGMIGGAGTCFSVKTLADQRLSLRKLGHLRYGGSGGRLERRSRRSRTAHATFVLGGGFS